MQLLPNLNTPLTGEQASGRLRRCRGQVLREWESRCRQQIPTFGTSVRPALLDALVPEFLDEIARYLGVTEGEPFPNEYTGEKQPCQYQLGDLLHEFQLMRGVLLECLQTEGALEPGVLTAFHYAAEKAIRRAANWYCKKAESLLLNAIEQEKELRSEVEYSLKELNRIEGRLRAAISVAKVGFYDWDMFRDTIVFSEQMQKDWDLPPITTLEKVMVTVHPDHREGVARRIQHAIATRTSHHHEYRVIRSDGSEAWIETQGQPSYDDLGRATRYLGTSINITERKQTELALQHERHKLESIVRDSPAAIALWRGREMVFELVNNTYQDIFPGRKLIGKTLIEAAPELKDQPFMELLQKVFDTGEPFVGREIMANIAKTDGGPVENRYYDFSYTRVMDSQGKPYGVYDHADDVTDRVVARQKLEESQLRLEQLVAALKKERDMRDRFVATLSHDLRAPLAASRLGAHMMTRHAEASPEIVRHADRVVASVDRANQIIEQLLDVSRMQTGQSLNVPLIPLELCRVVKECLSPLEEAYGPRFHLKIEDDFWVKANADALKRILDNLCSNAVKYGAKESRVTIGVKGDKETVSLAVHNEGVPLSETDRMHLFEPFKRTESAEKGTQEGWGLGLAIVRALATAHGGRVELESSKKTGTTFKITLPAAEPAH